MTEMYLKEKGRRHYSLSYITKLYHSYITKLYHKAIVTKTALYWHKNRHINKGDRTKDEETTSSTSSHLIFDKSTNNICWIKGTLFKGAVKTGYPSAEWICNHVFHLILNQIKMCQCPICKNRNTKFSEINKSSKTIENISIGKDFQNRIPVD